MEHPLHNQMITTTKISQDMKRTINKIHIKNNFDELYEISTKIAKKFYGLDWV
jgi:hypothetical protein